MLSISALKRNFLYPTSSSSGTRARLRYYLNYLLLFLLITDPLYYCVFFFLGTGDIHGVSLSFGVPKVLVFVIALLLLVMNTYLSEKMGWKVISRFKLRTWKKKLMV